jgi:hypothetical protein
MGGTVPTRVGLSPSSSPQRSKLYELHGRSERVMLSFDRNVHNRIRKMQTRPPNDDDVDEQALLDRELRAFERRQRALMAVTAHCKIYENGGWQPGKGDPPSDAALDEFKAADAEWREARAECERVVDEIDVAS